MKKNFLLMVLVFFFTNLNAQQKEHKIVFDYTKGDTASFSTMMRQARNIIKATNNAKIEIVCYGPGLDMLMTDRTTVKKDIEELHAKHNVVFAACEASMQRRGIIRSQLLTQVATVPLASLELSSKQQEGWSYLKAGYAPAP